MLDRAGFHRHQIAPKPFRDLSARSVRKIGPDLMADSHAVTLGFDKKCSTLADRQIEKPEIVGRDGLPPELPLRDHVIDMGVHRRRDTPNTFHVMINHVLMNRLWRGDDTGLDVRRVGRGPDRLEMLDDVPDRRRCRGDAEFGRCDAIWRDGSGERTHGSNLVLRVASRIAFRQIARASHCHQHVAADSNYNNAECDQRNFNECLYQILRQGIFFICERGGMSSFFLLIQRLGDDLMLHSRQNNRFRCKGRGVEQPVSAEIVTALVIVVAGYTNL